MNAQPDRATQPDTAAAEPHRITVATTWLDGCSGCHMSFLDMDERLAALAQRIDVVYSPFVDAKELPEQVDLGIIEGSVSNEDDLHKAKLFRQRCRLLVSLGDCAVTGNVPAMRNPFRLDSVYERAYRENVNLNQQIPSNGVPALLQTVQPVHGIVDVDVFIPGCPPSADTIHSILCDLIEGRTPEPIRITRFGA